MISYGSTASLTVRKPFLNDIHSSASCLPIPEGRNLAFLAGSLERLTNGRDNPVRLEARQPIGAHFDGDRSFRIVPQRNARHAEGRRFLLNAAGIGQYNACL